MRPYSWGTWKPPGPGATPPPVAHDEPGTSANVIPLWSHPLFILIVGCIVILAIVAIGYHFGDGAVFVPPAP